MPKVVRAATRDAGGVKRVVPLARAPVVEHKSPPEGAENKLNAWYYKSTVQGAPAGKLKGKTIVLKDNVMLAGVPMMNGASTLEGYMPEVDATIVTRILDAGGTILGDGNVALIVDVQGLKSTITHKSAA